MAEPKLLHDYRQFLYLKESNPNATVEFLSHLWISLYQSDQQNRYSKPMPWIGLYIAIASLFCILAMVADLLHGLKYRKLWFPCKYFTLNAASLTVIAVAIKLPMDLTTLMPGYVDQATKFGSMGFMCTMMANLLPSLATMDSKELVSNIIALGVLVITLVVNVCIQLNTGVLSYKVVPGVSVGDIPIYIYESEDKRIVRIIYAGLLLMLIMLLIIYACSSLAILKSKQILESKYQEAHRTALKDEELQQPGRLLTVEKLKEHVSNYWIMAGTGSPQFMTACSAATSASGVICAFCAFIHFLILVDNVGNLSDYNSDYKWSMLVIHLTQFTGIMLGTIAPVSRCFAALSFKLSVKWIRKHIKVFKVESYWTQKLSDWKHSSIPFPYGSRKCKIVIHNLKMLVLCILIGFQTIVVVACKMITVIPVFFVICVLSFSHCWMWLKAMFCTVSGIVLVLLKVLITWILL